MKDYNSSSTKRKVHQAKRKPAITIIKEGISVFVMIPVALLASGFLPSGLPPLLAVIVLQLSVLQHLLSQDLIVEFGTLVRRRLHLFVPASGHKPTMPQLLLKSSVPFL